jgi:hypothetical protein
VITELPEQVVQRWRDLQRLGAEGEGDCASREQGGRNLTISGLIFQPTVRLDVIIVICSGSFRSGDHLQNVVVHLIEERSNRKTRNGTNTASAATPNSGSPRIMPGDRPSGQSTWEGCMPYPQLQQTESREA